ncbi:MAG: 3-hydroxyacyl-CoA dehydrogenase NAD-binding domain-containing protein [Oscillospiraceae bacterium]|nr:3-hydroxyacyl-CoA dehydrogenase NAD-binding domain-containing protein [Oscillospiraceae bacterium]
MNRDAVLIIGAGLMGSGIASRAALAGHKTVLYDIDDARTQSGKQSALDCIEELLLHELVSYSDAERARHLIDTESNLENACESAEYVIEAIIEDLGVKQELFAKLDELLPPEVLLLSNTSGLRITDIAGKMKNYPERALTAHFWFPGHLVPLVEVVIGEKSDPKHADTIKELLLLWGKAPVIVKRDLPGQLANRILQSVIREAVSIVEIGLCDAEDVDTAIKMGMGIRLPVWGPLEHVDAVGLDLCRNVQATVLADICAEKHPSKLFDEKVASGDLGAKSGRGFYDWSVKSMPNLADKRNRFIIEALKFHKAEEKADKYN